MPGRMRYVIFNSAIVLVSLLLVAALGEIAVRIIQPQHDAPRWFQKGGPYAFQLKPNFHQTYRFGKTGAMMEVQTNAIGLRDEPRDFNAPFFGKTIVVAGDSFVFGHGVNISDRLDTVLAQLLDPSESHVRIIDTGVPGWGTIQATSYVRDHFSLFNPDAVLLAFCGNDPDDDTQFLQRKGMYVGNTNFVNFPGKDFLRIHSHLYRYLLFHVTVLRHDLAMWARNRQGEKVEMDTQTAEAITPADWQRTLQTIRDFHRDLLAFNPNALLVVTMTNPKDDAIRNQLAKLDNGGNLRFLDLSARCQNLGLDEINLGFDQHWCPRMHKIAAEATADMLRRYGFGGPAASVTVSAPAGTSSQGTSQ